MVRCEDSEKIEDVGDDGLESGSLKESAKAELDCGEDGIEEGAVVG
jgi:hypothetical protein